MSGEAERAAAIRAERAAEERQALRELLVGRLSEAIDEHDDLGGGRCSCGYAEPYGIGVGLHQLEAQADAVIELMQR